MEATPTSTKWIEKKLLKHQIIKPTDVCRILEDYTSVPGTQCETEVLDFKREFPKSDQFRCHLVKSICEFANSRGGILVFGVDKHGNRVGITPEEASRLEPTKIQDILGSYIDATVEIHTVLVSLEGLQFGAVVVSPSDVPIVMQATGRYLVRQKSGDVEEKCFYEGTIWVREGAKGTLAHQKHINALIERMSLEHSKRMVRSFEKVAYLPRDAEVTVSRRKGLAVHPVDDPRAPNVHVIEATSTEPFDSMQDEVRSYIRAFRTNPQLRVPARVVAQWYLERDSIHDLDGVSELAFLSSVRYHGFAVYWASIMSRPKLKSLLLRYSTEPGFLDSSVPYVVLAFFWEERASLLEHLGQARAPRHFEERRKRLLEMDIERFLFWSRNSKRRTVKLPDGTLADADSFYGSREACLSVFDRLVAAYARGTSISAYKSLAFQLEILLYADPRKEN